jgi:hypothetical protein
MGGRRARSLKEIVGGGVSSLSAKFTRAVNQGDPSAVAVSSAKLLAGSKKTAGILFYVSQLTDFIRRIVESGRDLNYEDRLSLTRKEWSRIKRERNLDDDPVVTNAVVSAVARAIAKERK